MESNLPAEIIFQILQKIPSSSVNSYMLAQKATLESGQEIKKSQANRLLNKLPQRRANIILNRYETNDPLYWSKVYKDARKSVLAQDVKEVIESFQDVNTLATKTQKLIKLGNLLIENKDIVATMNDFKATMRQLLLDYSKLGAISHQEKTVIENIYYHLFPEFYDEDFGLGLDSIFE